jgi:hypothetical protein
MGKFRKSESVEIGGFDLIKMGTLRQFEEAWLEKHLADQADLVSLPALQFAQYLVDAENLSEQEATERLMELEGGGNDGMMAFLLKYKKAVPDIIDALINAPKIKAKSPLQIACFVLQNRLPNGYLQDNRHELMEDLGVDVAGHDEWQSEWMGFLDVDTINKLYEFFMMERMGWQSVALSYVADSEANSESQEPPTLGEESPPSKDTSPPTGENDGPQLKPLALTTPSLIGPPTKIAQSA